MEQSPTAPGTLRVALVALALTVLAGCGQKGDLVLPSAPSDTAPTAEQAEPAAAETTTP